MGDTPVTDTVAATGPRRRAPHWSWILAVAGLGFALLWIVSEGRERGLEQSGRRLQAEILAAQAQERAALGQSAQMRAAMALMADPGTQVIAVRSAPPSPGGRAYINAKRGAVLVATGLSPLPDGKRYELWLLPARGNAQAAGVFEPAASGATVRSVLRAVPGITGVAVSIEPGSGSPQPTGMIVLAAKQP